MDTNKPVINAKGIQIGADNANNMYCCRFHAANIEKVFYTAMEIFHFFNRWCVFCLFAAN